MTNETLRMQFLSGVITEGQYKTKLQENTEKESLNESMIGGIVGIGAINQIPPREKTDYETAFEHFLGERYETKFENRKQDPHTMNEADEAAAVGKKVEAAAEDKLESTVDNLSDEQKDQLRAELAKAGITANSKMEDVAGKLDESLFEGEGDTKQKVASALSAIGGGLMRSMLVPLIPLIVGHTTGTGFGGGLAITAGVAGALIALAKLLGGEESMEEGKEVEESSLYENVGDSLNKFLDTFEFSEKGNDEMIEFANLILSPEGPKKVAMQIKGRLKGEGGENYFTSKPEELDAFLSKLKGDGTISDRIRSKSDYIAGIEENEEESN